MAVFEGKFKGQRAFVSGAAGAIGHVVVNRLLKEGSSVLAFDCSSEGVASLQTNLGHYGNCFQAVVGDVSATASVDDAFVQAGSVTLLVTCASVYSTGPTNTLSVEEWQRTLDVNLKGTFLCCRAAARIMLKRRSGAIVTIASSSGLSGSAGEAAYSASMGAITGFSKSLARELGPTGIRVNCIAPVGTPHFRSPQPETDNCGSGHVPLKRTGTPADIADLVLFLLSDESRHITGQVIHCNGEILTRWH